MASKNLLSSYNCSAFLKHSSTLGNPAWSDQTQRNWSKSYQRNKFWKFSGNKVTFSCNSLTSVTVPWHLAHDLMRWFSLPGNNFSKAIQVSLKNNNVLAYLCKLILYYIKVANKIQKNNKKKSYVSWQVSDNCNYHNLWSNKPIRTLGNHTWPAETARKRDTD